MTTHDATVIAVGKRGIFNVRDTAWESHGGVDKVFFTDIWRRDRDCAGVLYLYARQGVHDVPSLMMYIHGDKPFGRV